MSEHHVFFLFLAACSAVVVFRAIEIIERMHWRADGNSYGHFAAFGLSYVLLAAGAVIVAIEAASGALTLGGLCIIVASAGLIVFDNRRPKQ
jgi:hypothetical protein